MLIRIRAASCDSCTVRLAGASVLSRETWIVRARPTVEETYRPGTIIGAYRLDRLLGQGAVGLVYQATHTKLGRRVALKILRRGLATNRLAVARFFAEAQVVNALAHENIVAITDFVEGNAEEETPCHFVMELLEGQTLFELLGEERLEQRRALGIAAQIAKALAVAHERAVVHRDLKPENVFVGPGDRVKLLDFGVAKLSTEGGLAAIETAAGTLIGTPGYIAPEQTLDADVDPRADVYALGVILFEMVTGRPPFVEQDVRALLRLHRSEPAPNPADVTLGTERVSRPLADLILACLEKMPDARPENGRAVLERLERLRGAGRSARLLALVPAAIAAIGVAGGLWGMQTEPIESRAPVVIDAVTIEPDVHVRLESEPPGARVLVDGEVLGQTPLVRAFPKGDGHLDVRFELEGRRPVTQRVPVLSDQRVSVVLAEIPGEPMPKKKKTKRRRARRKEIAPSPPHAGVPRDRVSRTRVIDPFEGDR